MIQTLPLVQPHQHALIRASRHRRLGSLFIPQRRAYLLYMPLLLLASALPCYAFGTDSAMIFAALVLSAISLYLVFDLLGRRSPLRVSTVLAFTLGLGYGLGTVNTWFTLPRAGEALGDFFNIPPRILAYGMGSVLLSVALLLAVGELMETPVFGEEFELRFNNRSIVFLTFGTLVLLASFASGATSFMGSTDVGAEAGHVSAFATLAAWFSGSLLALSVCVSVNIQSRFLRLYTRGLSILLFLMVFPLGRRVMIYAVVLSIIGLRLGRYKVPYSPLKKVVLLALMGLVLYFANIGFYFLRVAGYGMVKPTLFQRVDAGIRLFENNDYADIKQEFAKNVQKRTFILGFLAQLEDYASNLSGAHGQDIAGYAELAVPSVLFPGKDVYFTEEVLADSLFGAAYTDEPNSVLTTGATDFGLLGVLLYPLLLVFMVRVFFEFIAETLPVFASCFVVLASLSTVLEPEVTVTAYFLILRNGVLFGAFIWFIMSVPEFRIRNVDL